MKHAPRAIVRRQILSVGFVGGCSLALPACARSGSPVVDVETYRDGSRSDIEIVRSAIAALIRYGTGTLRFEAGRTYHLGGMHAPNPFLHLHDLRDAVIDGNGAQLLCNTLGFGKTQLFLVQRCKRLIVRNFRSRDASVNLWREWQGMDFIHLETSGGPIQDIMVDSVEVDGAVSLLTCSGQRDTPRATRLRFSRLVARNCYYGLSFQENFDDVSGDLTAVNCRRAYIAYGVTNHTISLDIQHDRTSPGANACIMIKRYTRDTQRLSIFARFSGQLSWDSLVKLEQQPSGTDQGAISDIKLELFVDPSVIGGGDVTRLSFSSIGSDGIEKITRNQWHNISLSGCLGHFQGPAARVSAKPVDPVELAVSGFTAPCPAS